jgi:transcriptional regulator with XRE-family HTH domain
MNIMENIGMKIRKLRERRGDLTQEYVAQKLNMTAAGYSKIERDVTDVTMGKLLKIAKILDLDVRQILEFDEHNIFNFPHSTNQQAVVTYIEKTNEDLVQLLVKELRSQITYLQTEVHQLRADNLKLVEIIAQNK